jgi:sugar lactone lactonase YvrE
LAWRGYQDGAVSAAQFHNPNGVAVDSSGNILVADSGNNVIRRIAPDGTVATVAGRPGPYGAGYADGNGNQAGFNFPAAICLDSTANAYVADYFNNAVRKVTPAAAVSTLAGSPYPNGSADGRGRNAEFSAPSGAALDSLGRLYVADTGNSTIRLITPDGTVTTVAGTAGSIGSSDGAGAAARFNHPMGVAVDGEGNVYVADTGNNTIRKISTQGAVTTIAGVPGTGGAVDGPASSAQFNTPRGLALDSAGNVFIADSWNHAIRRLSTSGQVSTFAGQTGSPGSADGTGTAAQFDAPTGLAFDVHGNLYVADRINSTIRVITPQGVVTTLAGLAPTTGIIVEETDGPGYNDGVGSGARFYNPSGVAVDALGNIFVADSFNNTIRRVKPDGTVTTLAGAAPFTGWQDGVGSAARFSYPIGIAVAVDGTLWITDGDGTTVRNGAALPEFSRNPSSQTVVSGRTVVFSVAVTESSAAPTYQWSFNDMLIPGATDSALLVRGASAAQAGNYTCSVTNSAGTTTTPAATLTVVNTTDPGRLINLSCRSLVGTGANVLIAGFVVGGNGTSGSETLLVRASGPALVPFDVTGVLPDPDLQLISSNSNSLVAANNGWGGSALISTTAAAVGAFPWTDTSSHDSALVETLLPGPYTALVAGASGDSGIALAEIYDATPTGTYSPTTPRLINISARTQVGLGANVLIAGFVIGGTTSETVLIRASGPALVPFGVSSVLPDPQLQLNSSASVIATNAGWGGDAQIASTAASIGAFSWGTTATADSALLVTLPPGAYTAEVSGKSGDTGIALVEVYEVQ